MQQQRWQSLVEIGWMVYENTAFLSRAQSDAIVGRLNECNQQSLSAVWEVAVLNAFSKFGKVEYEKEGLGSSNPDLYFAPSESPSVDLIAEIRAVSDQDYLDHNLGWELEQLLCQKIEKLSLPQRGYTLVIEGYEVDWSDRQRHKNKKKLRIPDNRVELERAIFGGGFLDFASRIKKNPGRADSYRVDTSEAGVSLFYEPTQDGLATSSPSYRIALAATHNPIFNALVDKAKQLKKANRYTGPRGIILCDAGSNLFRESSAVGLGQIIAQFLRNQSSIDFVISISCQSKLSLGSGRFEKTIEVKCFQKPSSTPLDPSIIASIRRFATSFPKVVTDSETARLNARLKQSSRESNSFSGGFEWIAYENGVRMKFSARVLLDYLAGRIDHADFLQQTSAGLADMVGSNPFAARLEKSELISDIRFERGESEGDDDWVILRLTGPDPAISEFRAQSS